MRNGPINFDTVSACDEITATKLQRQPQRLSHTSSSLQLAGRLPEPELNIREDSKKAFETSKEKLPLLSERGYLSRTVRTVTQGKNGVPPFDHTKCSLETKLTSISDDIDASDTTPREITELQESQVISKSSLGSPATHRDCSGMTLEETKTCSPLAHQEKAEPPFALGAPCHETLACLPGPRCARVSLSDETPSNSQDFSKPAPPSELVDAIHARAELDKLKAAQLRLKTRVIHYKQAQEKVTAQRNEARMDLVHLRDRFDAMERLFLDSAKDESAARRECRLAHEQLDLAYRKIERLLPHGHQRSISEMSVEYKDRLLRAAGEELAIRNGGP